MKPKKRFGIWTSAKYQSQISANKKLYRTIYDHALKHVKKERKVKIATILKNLGIGNTESVRRGFYRSQWGRKLVLTRHFL